MRKTVSVLLGVIALALFSIISPAFAQDSYPASPIRLVVGFAPGGSSDLVARVVAQRLSGQMNTPVVVENRVGAGSNLAAEYVAKSRPDGYTLLLAPISLVATSPQLLFVYPGVPANTIAEFIAHVRANRQARVRLCW